MNEQQKRQFIAGALPVKRVIDLQVTEYEDGTFSVRQGIGTHYGSSLEQMLLERALDLGHQFDGIKNCVDAVIVRRNWVLDTVTDLVRRQEDYEKRAREKGIC